DLQTRYTGGTVLHGFLGERISDPEVAKSLVKKIVYNYKLPYFTITPTFSICPKHGYIQGEHRYCPKCDKEMGYTEETVEIPASEAAAPKEAFKQEVEIKEEIRVSAESDSSGADEERNIIQAIA
ncbi:hypothetical protein GF382_00640, partial [Candidatus Falkowbacteria bacterium]|nr:hypothetical protein [Candidatus Falkowbacteria bacterium]